MPMPWSVTRTATSLPGAGHVHLDVAVLARVLHGVGEHVLDRLLHGAGVDVDRGQAGLDARHDVEAALLELALQPRHHVARDLAEVGRDRAIRPQARLHPREVEHVLDQARELLAPRR